VLLSRYAPTIRAKIGRDIQDCVNLLARNHALSSYIPICRGCGLILCELNMPYHACPHCSFQILTPPVRTSLLVRLDAQISERLAKEERDREQAIEDARKAAGAFPTLAAGVSLSSEGSGTVVGGTVAPRPINEAIQNQTHKVLSLNSKTKKVTLSSYTQSLVPSRLPSRPLSRAEDDEPEPTRVPRPPSEVAFVGKLDNTRPWADLKSAGSGVRYVPAPVSVQSRDEGIEEGAVGRRRRRRRHTGGNERAQERNEGTKVNPEAV
jgi:hypothetical protein